jgi:hypothetical protein
MSAGVASTPSPRWPRCLASVGRTLPGARAADMRPQGPFVGTEAEPIRDGVANPGRTPASWRRTSTTAPTTAPSPPWGCGVARRNPTIDVGISGRVRGRPDLGVSGGNAAVPKTNDSGTARDLTPDQPAPAARARLPRVVRVSGRSGPSTGRQSAGSSWYAAVAPAVSPSVRQVAAAVAEESAVMGGEPTARPAGIRGWQVPSRDLAGT